MSATNTAEGVVGRLRQKRAAGVMSGSIGLSQVLSDSTPATAVDFGELQAVILRRDCVKADDGLSACGGVRWPWEQVYIIWL